MLLGPQINRMGIVLTKTPHYPVLSRRAHQILAFCSFQNGCFLTIQCYSRQKSKKQIMSSLSNSLLQPTKSPIVFPIPVLTSFDRAVNEFFETHIARVDALLCLKLSTNPQFSSLGECKWGGPSYPLCAFSIFIQNLLQILRITIYVGLVASLDEPPKKLFVSLILHKPRDGWFIQK